MNFKSKVAISQQTKLRQMTSKLRQVYFQNPSELLPNYVIFRKNVWTKFGHMTLLRTKTRPKWDQNETKMRRKLTKLFWALTNMTTSGRSPTTSGRSPTKSGRSPTKSGRIPTKSGRNPTFRWNYDAIRHTKCQHDFTAYICAVFQKLWDVDAIKCPLVCNTYTHL